MPDYSIMTKDTAIRGAKIKASTFLKNPISDATHNLSEISFLVVRLQLENGIIGESYMLIDNPMLIHDGFATTHDLQGWGSNFLDKPLTEIK